MLRLRINIKIPNLQAPFLALNVLCSVALLIHNHKVITIYRCPLSQCLLSRLRAKLIEHLAEYVNKPTTRFQQQREFELLASQLTNGRHTFCAVLPRHNQKVDTIKSCFSGESEFLSSSGDLSSFKTLISLASICVSNQGRSRVLCSML